MLIVLWIVAMIVLQAPSLALTGDLSRPALLPAVASMVVATMLPLAVWPWPGAALDRAGGTLVAFGGSAVRTGLTAGLYLGGVMAGTEAALLLVPRSG
jgi:hypothetical protein